MTTTQQHLQQLESTLSTLKDQYQTQAAYSEVEHKRRQADARQHHIKAEEFTLQSGLYSLPNFLAQKFSVGYTYEEAIENLYTYPMSPTLFIRLVKPSDVLDTEYAALELGVKVKYLDEIESLKEQLINEIASTQLQIKATQKVITDESKQQRALDTELAKVRAELTGDTESVVESTNG